MQQLIDRHPSEFIILAIPRFLGCSSKTFDDDINGTLITFLTSVYIRLTSERESIPLERLLLDKNLYRRITKIAYSENKPVERVVNDILREYIDVFFPLRKIGLVHVTTDTIKMIFQDISDELIIDHAKSLSKRYMEVITLLNKNRTLDDYLDFFKIYSNASGYQMEVTTSQSGGKRVIMRFNLGRKYSLYLGECFKRFCIVNVGLESVHFVG